MESESKRKCPESRFSVVRCKISRRKSPCEARCPTTQPTQQAMPEKDRCHKASPTATSSANSCFKMKQLEGTLPEKVSENSQKRCHSQMTLNIDIEVSEKPFQGLPRRKFAATDSFESVGEHSRSEFKRIRTQQQSHCIGPCSRAPAQSRAQFDFFPSGDGVSGNSSRGRISDIFWCKCKLGARRQSFPASVAEEHRVHTLSYSANSVSGSDMSLPRRVAILMTILSATSDDGLSAG